jgi:hypothetical protein
VLNSAFSRDEEHPFDFLSFLPRIFTPERIGEHLVYLKDGRMLGCVGLYPYEVRVGGVSFQAAGLGQVGTIREARGQGVMTTLLTAICKDADAAGYDFCWLGGDRTRYGRHGWATGGVRMRFYFPARYLPEPPPEADVRPLEPERDFARIRDCIDKDPNTVVVDDLELRRMLESRSTGGWVSGDAFIVHRRGIGNVYMARGATDEIGKLLAHHLRWLRAQPEWRGDLTIQCAPADSDLMRAAQKYYAGMGTDTGGMWRVGPLKPFLEKVCRVAQPRIACGAGSVTLSNADSRETATLTCTDGRLAVQDGAGGAPSYSMGRRELSEACFGQCPLDVYLPGLPADSFLRQVLPLRAHWSRFFGV